MQIKLRYFARLREQLDTSEEVLNLPADLFTVAQLISLLCQRGPQWHAELGGERIFRVAVDQELVDLSAQLHDGAEVAIFPPVTGG